MTRWLWLVVLSSLLLLGCGQGGAGPSGSASSSGAQPATKPPRPSASVGSGTPTAPGPGPTAVPADRPLRIGATLHPYFSWTKNVVGEAPGVEVRSILPGEVDAGDYQPRPADIAKIGDLDAMVINGIGHDDFIQDMIRASGNARLQIIRPNDGTPTVKGAHGEAVNSHTFISFTNAVQQTYAIERALSAMRPDLAPTFRKNASEYARRLRAIKDQAAKKLSGAKLKRVVTVHDGYVYLCQEFGIDIAGVVQPSHGLVPSAEELAALVDLLKREKIEVVLSEESFPPKMLDVLRESARVKVYVITHIASGEYTADKFEKEMAKNAETLVKALVTDPG